MLRGLVIRQVFVVVDLSLALLVAAIAYLVIMEMFESTNTARTATDDPSAVAEVKLAEVAPRENYNRLVEGGMFGDAGKMMTNVATEVKPIEEKPVETALPLKLKGTTLSGGAMRLASAIIESSVDRSVRTYFIYQEVILGQVTLQDVHKGEVVLKNNSTNRLEILRMEEEALAGIGAAAPNPVVTTKATDRIALKREELITEFAENYGKWATDVKPRAHVDASGKVDGFTADNIGQIPIAKKLGLKEGDVVQTINGEALDSDQKIVELVTKFQNVSTFRVGLLRDGKPTMITYDLR